MELVVKIDCPICQGNGYIIEDTEQDEPCFLCKGERDLIIKGEVLSINHDDD